MDADYKTSTFERGGVPLNGWSCTMRCSDEHAREVRGSARRDQGHPDRHGPSKTRKFYGYLRFHQGRHLADPMKSRSSLHE